MGKKKGEVSEFKKKEDIKEKKKFNLTKMLSIAAVIFVVAYFIVSGMKIIGLREEKKEAEARYEELLHQKEVLAKEYENISSDEYIEMLARRDLKLVKPNELLFILPDMIENAKDKKSSTEKDNEKSKEANNETGKVEN